jgi:hypothetical protein
MHKTWQCSASVQSGKSRLALERFTAKAKSFAKEINKLEFVQATHQEGEW